MASRAVEATTIQLCLFRFAKNCLRVRSAPSPSPLVIICSDSRVRGGRCSRRRREKSRRRLRERTFCQTTRATERRACCLAAAALARSLCYLLLVLPFGVRFLLRVAVEWLAARRRADAAKLHKHNCSRL